LAGLEGRLKVVKRPFDFISEDEFEIADGLLHIEEMMAEGVITRLGAIVNHHKLGFTANAMLVCKARKTRVIEIGEKLAGLNIVSHCYERKTFKNFPYNLFAMMHGRSMAEVRQVIEKFVRRQRIVKWEVLPTEARLFHH
jgi:DNA-binding Lrp family transcriptional regulator